MHHNAPVLMICCVSCELVKYVFLYPKSLAGGHGVDNSRGDKVRVFRAEKNYAVTQGKWYFEFEVMTTGEMRVGWARPNVHADTELGADELAYVFNGCRVSTYPYF